MGVGIVTPILPILATIPRPVLALLLMVAYCAAVRWRLAPWMVVDWALLALLVWQPSLGLAAWVGALLIVRHVPTLAEDIASGLKLHEYTGLTAACMRVLLPGARSLMVSDGDGEDETQGAAPVSISVSDMAYRPPPQGADIADMDAQIIDMRRVARDITDDQILMLLCELRKPNGTYRHSMNEVYRRVGGDRNTVMAKIKAIRENAPAAQFRQEDGSTAPAHRPVTKG